MTNTKMCSNAILPSSDFTVNITRELSNLNFSNYANSIFIVHQNIRSLRQNFNTLISNLSVFPRKPDFIFVSEIWIFSTEIDNFSIPGYNFYAVPNDSSPSGGVGVFIKTSFNCQTFSCDMVSADTLKVSFTLDKDVFTFLCFYRLHSHPVDTFLVELTDLLNRVKCKNLLLLGDFNIDLLADCDLVDKYLTILANNGVYSLLNEPTRPESGTCLDHILARFKNPEILYNCLNMDLELSDHCMTGFILPITAPLTKPNSKKTFSKIDYTKLNELLLSEHWYDVYNAADVDTAYSLFLRKLKHYINASTVVIPLKNTGDQKLKPWITTDLLKKIKLKNKLKAKSLKHPQNSSLKTRLKKLLKSIKSDIPTARENFYKNKFHNCNGDIKKEWQLLNDITNNSSRSKKTEYSLLIDDNLCSDSNVVANEFNDYFSSIASVSASFSDAELGTDLENDVFSPHRVADPMLGHLSNLWTFKNNI